MILLEEDVVAEEAGELAISMSLEKIVRCWLQLNHICEGLWIDVMAQEVDSSYFEPCQAFGEDHPVALDEEIQGHYPERD